MLRRGFSLTVGPAIWSIAFSTFALTLPAYGQAPRRASLASKLQPCSPQGVESGALCAKFDVPETRGTVGGRTIALNIVVLPATSDSIASDALLFLAGGGVVPATRYAAFLTRALPTLRRNRDVVLIDQRGTWNSNPLNCSPPGPSAEAQPPSSERMVAATIACRDSLAARADLRAYTTSAAIEDIEAVRAWLGYNQVSFYAVSYGTKVAQAYLRAHPDRARAAALYGVVPISQPSQLDLAGSAQRSLNRVFDLCAADGACRSAFPRVSVEFDSLLRRLTAAPARVSLARPDGASIPVTITDRAVRDLTQAMLGGARSIERLPVLIQQASAGQYEPLARAIIGDGPPPPPGPPRGVFLSILCSEAIPQVREGDIESATRATFFGDAPVRSQMQTCASWPRATLPGDFWQPVRAAVPVLAMSGDLDPITPPQYGELVVSGLANARHIVLSNRSHNDVDPCITSLVEQFLIAGNAARLDTSCVARPAPLRFATQLPAPPG
jgi:pimeloyl-ACP methyl ester carboxylesterase